MKKLISMTDFVLQQRMTTEEINKSSFFDIQTHIATHYDRVFAYANFLKQPLTLEMFVPCDENGNVLTEPEDFEYYLSDNEQYFNRDIEDSVEYANALEKILFKEFKVINSYFENSKHTIFLENPQGDFIGQKHDWEENWDLYGTTVEDMLNLVGNEIELTEYAIKQIFGDA